VLAGKIWSQGSRRFIDERELAKRLASADYVLLGEQHDNRRHHEHQAWVVAELLRFARRPVIAMEMLTPDDEEIVRAYSAGNPADAAGLGEALGWSARGWPPWQDYQPIADVAVRNGLRLASAALSDRETDTLRAAGKNADTQWLLQRLGINKPLSEQEYDSIAQEIRDTHCGYAPASIIPSMVLVQRSRDARMAESLELADTGRGAVLIAGTGHVRNDRGVPSYLRRRNPQASVATVAFVEVRPELQRPVDYEALYDGSTAPFDYLWFTRRVERADPCEEFREVLQGLGQRESE
jgi:uncharacterized iron-regulated protein